MVDDEGVSLRIGMNGIPRLFDSWLVRVANLEGHGQQRATPVAWAGMVQPDSDVSVGFAGGPVDDHVMSG